MFAKFHKNLFIIYCEISENHSLLVIMCSGISVLVCLFFFTLQIWMSVSHFILVHITALTPPAVTAAPVLMDLNWQPTKGNVKWTIQVSNN